MTTQVANPSTSSSPPIRPLDRRMDDALTVILNTLEYLDGHPVAESLPSPELRKEIALRLEDIRRALLPLGRAMAERELAERAVAALLQSTNMRAADPRAKVAEYTAVLSDLPVWAVKQACHDFARGLVEGVNPDFPPTAARVHQHSEAVLAPLRKEAKRLETVRAVTLKANRRTPEERQRMALNFLALKDELAREPEHVCAANEVKRVMENQAARKAQQLRARKEWAEVGIAPPASPLALSPTCLRDMALRDAAREPERA